MPHSLTIAAAQSPLPARLLEGFASFRARLAGGSECYRAQGESAQRPSVMIIACCDSRAAPETIFDAGPGEIFVARNVANLVPPYAPDGRHHSTSAALEFAVLSLGVKHVVVMGHGRCGGIRAALASGDPLTSSDFIGKWVAAVRDVADLAPRPHYSSDIEHETAVERASIEHSLANLRTFPWIRARESRREISLHGAWFDIALGELHAFDNAAGLWRQVEAIAR